MMIRLKKYSITFKLAMQSEMQYRTNFFLSFLSSVFPMVMSLFLWTAIYQNTIENTVYGYNYIQMIAYTIMAGVVSTLVSAGFAPTMSNDIRSGSLSKFLTIPIGYLRYRLFNFLGEKTVHLVISFLIIMITLWMCNTYFGFYISLFRVFMFLIVLVLAIALNFLIFFSVGISAFWVVQTSYLFWAAKEFIKIASGGVFPIDIFGQTVVTISNYLPFKYTIYYPINVLNGKLAMSEILHGIVVQCVWIVIISIITNLLWKKGIKDYVAVGG